jgi:hypothetical protein
MLNVPILHPEEVSEEKLNAYYNRIRHGKIAEQEALAIYRYLEYYFGSWEGHRPPEVVKTSTKTPQEVGNYKKQPQREPAEMPQEEQPIAQREPAQIPWQELTTNLGEIKLPHLKKPSRVAVSKQELEEVQKELQKAKRQAQQKEIFLQQLAQTQTTIGEKLKMYKQAYPADRIDIDVLQEVLQAYV